MQPGNGKNSPRDRGASKDEAKSTNNLKPVDGKKRKISAAHREALHDIELDADLSIHSPNDYLDEGETARLGEDKTDLV